MYTDLQIEGQLNQIPQYLRDLNWFLCVGIEIDTLLKGKVKINLNKIPNGHYSLYYLRIGLPLELKSRIKVLGKAFNLYVNINRDLV